MNRKQTFVALISFFALVAMAGWTLGQVAPAADPNAALAAADRLRAEGSFRAAREAYDQVLGMPGLPDAIKQIAQVHRADAEWRERAGGQDGARRQLERSIEDLPDTELRAEAAESLGDLWLENDPYGKRDEMIENWLLAVHYWGNATDLAAAKPRYIALNFKIAEAIIDRLGGVIPLPRTARLERIGILPPAPPQDKPWMADTATFALRNVLRVSQDPAERTRALVMLGRQRVRNWQNDETWKAEAEDYLKQAAAIEPQNEWTDDALFELGQFYYRQQRFVEAAAAFKDLTTRFRKGDAPQWDSADHMLREITSPQIHLSGNEAFAPGSYLRFDIQYRNLSEARLIVRRAAPDACIDAWKSSENPGRRRRGVVDQRLAGEVVYDQPVEGMTNDGKHAPQTKTVWLEPMQTGIYQAEIVSAQAASSEDAQLFNTFLITRLALAIKHDGLQSIVWTADAETGKPAPGSEVRLVFFYQYRDRGNRATRWQELTATADETGIARFTRPAPAADEHLNARLYALATRGDDGIAFQDQGWANAQESAQGDTGQPLLYAYTDRPAYRPGEPINWKLILRFSIGKEYQLPKTEQVFVTLRDARGNVIQEGLQTLDNYGAAKGMFMVDRSAALGVIQMEVRDPARNEWSQHAQLCRIEEYKLPEFKVSVEPQQTQVRFGGAVPFAIAAEYYFGGPVAGADVEIVVHRNAFWPRWRPFEPWGWFYGGDSEIFGFGMRRGRGGYFSHPYEPEQIVLQKTMKLNAEGKAHVEVGALTDEEIKNAKDRGFWGYQYRVEARVVDASRREVSGSGSIKVARTAFAAYLTPQRFVYLPGDTVKIDLKTLDPNDKPVQAQGLVTIFERKWDENKVNAQGAKEPGYVDTELLSKSAATDNRGEGLIEFQPQQEGYYYFKFAARDQFGEEVTGETTVMVCSTESDAIGYRSGGVEIIADKKTYVRGETAHVLLAVRRAGAHVWFGVEGESIFSEQVVPVEGTVKLVPVMIDPSMEPNVYLTAVAMFDYSGFRDTKTLQVPPTRRFLDVKVAFPKEDFRPGEKTLVDVEIKDDAGNPVTTQLSLGVADAAVWAIQDDLAPDIRSHFWGHQRGLNISTQSSAERYSIIYWKPIEGKPGEYEPVRRENIAGERDNYEREDSRSVMLFGADMAATGRMPATMTATDGQVAGQGKKLAMEMAPGQPMSDDAGGVEPRVRTDFRGTALWLADVVTDGDGHASAEVTWPDSLTSWKAVARAADRDTRVGQVTTEVKTNKPIMVRPQAPRFFVQGDRATVSAIVNNNTSESQVVEVKLEILGLLTMSGDAIGNDPTALQDITSPVQGLGNVGLAPPKPGEINRGSMTIRVPANNQRRVDWVAIADAPGSATLTMSAVASVDSDAAQKTYPVFEYGIEQFIAQGATIRETEPTVEKTITLRVPEARREGSEGLTIWIEPTLAKSMVNALPYLAGYPYGCVEQTLSRFVPAVIVDKTLQQLSIDNPELKAKLPDMIKTGLDRLYDFQHEDGGWAWWKEGASDPFMTAYVLDGLAQARDAGVEVRQDVIDRAASFLSQELVKLDPQPDMQSFALYALAMARNDGGHKDMVDASYNRLWPRREELNPYTRALLALACHLTERAEWSQILVRNMRNGIIDDPGNGTAHWGAAGVHWRWSEGGIEATAFSLRALLAIDPQNELIDRAMTWLARNRRGNRWKNTRDTAIVIRALADYITVRGEDKPDWTAEVRVNGQVVRTLTITPGAVFDFDGKIEIDPALLKTGDNTVVVTRRGSGVLYASTWLTYFTKEEEIPAAGNEVFIERAFHKITNQPTLAGEYREVREAYTPGSPLLSGERVEVELTIDAKNHYEYLVIEDLKAAGMEPVELQSGWSWNPGSGVSAHREFRDEKTAFFISHLSQGSHTLKYTLRAEVPGSFSALPAQIEAMYVPEIRGNSEGRRVEIGERVSR